MTNRAWVLAVAVSAFIPAIASGDDLTLEGTPRMYVGEDGAQVTVVPLKPRSAHHVLLKIEGTDTELDGKIYLHEVREQGHGADFQRTSGGQVTVTAREGWWSSREYELHPPRRRDAITIYYNQKKSEAVNGQEILDRYLGRRGNSVIKDRKQLVVVDEQALGDATKSANKACGTSFPARIAWDTVNDDYLQEFDVASHCASVLRAIEKICEDEVGKKAVSGQIREMTCRVGPQLQVLVNANKLTWTVTRGVGGSDAEDFARNDLERKL